MSKRKELAGQSFGSWYVEEFDVSRSKWKVRCKLKSGWSVERALTEKPFIGKNQTFRGA